MIDETMETEGAATGDPRFWKTLLCPTDFSDPSREALRTAGEMARALNARIVLLHAVPMTVVPPPGPVFFPSPALPPDVLGEAMNRTREHLEKLATEILPKGIVFNIFIVEGDAAEQIVKAAEDRNADVLVMATHGHQGWRHLLFGSVAEKVIRLSTKPVLVVKEPAPAES